MGGGVPVPHNPYYLRPEVFAPQVPLCTRPIPYWRRPNAWQHYPLEDPIRGSLPVSSRSRVRTLTGRTRRFAAVVGIMGDWDTPPHNPYY